MWTPKTEMMLLTLAIALLLSGLLFSWFPPTLAQETTTRQYDLNSQIIINTQRLSDLERRMKTIEEGGSALASNTAARTTINEREDARQDEEIRTIKNIIAGVGIFVATHLFATVMYFLKKREDKMDHKLERKDV